MDSQNAIDYLRKTGTIMELLEKSSDAVIFLHSFARYKENLVFDADTFREIADLIAEMEKIIKEKCQ